MAVILNPGSIVDKKYEVIKKIGKGSVGTVYEVKRLSDKKNVALKIADIYGDERLKRRLEREIRIMEKMDHPNVMPVLDSGEYDDLIYIVMPLATGSLCGELPAYKADHSKAFEAFQEVCIGVHAMHEAGVFHRDIKPANCLRRKNGRIAVSDFSVARFTERDTETLTTTNAQLGTAAYLAPEQLQPEGSRNADARTDVFQLGKTLYQFLTDELPMHMDLDKVPVGIRHIISKATRKPKEDRYQTVAELMDAVQLYLQSVDPDINTQAAFDNTQQAVNAKLKDNRYSTSLLQQLFGYASKLLDEDLPSGMSSFESIKDEVLVLGVTHALEETREALKRYVKAVEEHIGGMPWEHAVPIARSMMKAYSSTEDTDARMYSLEAALIAAVDRHRFTAMDTVVEMLKLLKEADGIPAAEMLRRRMKYIKVLTSRLTDRDVPMAVRQILKEIREAEKKKED